MKGWKSHSFALIAALLLIGVIAYQLIERRGQNTPRGHSEWVAPQRNTASVRSDSVLAPDSPSTIPDSNSSNSNAGSEVSQRDKSEPVNRTYSSKELIEIARICEKDRSRFKEFSLGDANIDLAAMLSDELHTDDWRGIALLLALNDCQEDGVEALLRYIRRGDQVQGSPVQRALFFNGKVNMIAWLGIIHDDQIVDVLRNLLTDDGARKFVAEWPDVADTMRYYQNSELLYADIRGSAAIGLIYTEDPENARLVELLYAEIKAAVLDLASERPSGKIDPNQMTLAEVNLLQLHASLSSALAVRDAISDLGLHAYIFAEASGRENSALFGYVAPYMQEVLGSFVE